MANPIDLIIVRGTNAQFDSIPDFARYLFRVRQVIDHGDDTYSFQGYGTASDQLTLTNLGLAVTVVLTETELNQHLSVVESQMAPPENA